MVTGGAGYVGSYLVPHLLAEGYKVVVYDTCWFGNGFLPLDNGSLELVKGDIRDIESFKQAVEGCHSVIHLACLSNDVSCQLDEKLSTEINYHAFEPLVIASKEAGVKRFIYCSSSSVYGVSEAPDVTEDHPLVPLTLYNKYKGMCEPLLFKHQSEDFECVTLRPATVCGYAPRMRFDLTVNIMTNHAVQAGKITVFGGGQRRPNLNIKDMVDVYKRLLDAPASLIRGQTFNAGRQNMKVIEIAQLISQTVSKEMGKDLIPIEVKGYSDNRSYHINSDKIKNVLGWEPKYSVEDAIADMCVRFKSGLWKDSMTNPLYTNIKQYVDKHGFGGKTAA